MIRTIWIIVAIFSVLGIFVGGTYAQGAGNPLVNQIIDIVTDIQTTVNGIDTEVTNIEGKLDGTVPSSVSDIKTETDKIQMVKDDVGAIKTETDKIQMIKDDIASISTGTSLEPFTIVIQSVPLIAEICDVAGGGPDTDQLIIGNFGTGGFIVTGILFTLNGVDSATDTFVIKELKWGSTTTDMPTPDLTGTYSLGVGLDPFPNIGFDIMGQPLTTGGLFPHQLSSARGEIQITFECNAGTTNNMNILRHGITVMGWKEAGAIPTIDYNESP